LVGPGGRTLSGESAESTVDSRPSTGAEPAEELAELAAAVRAFVEWHEITGSSELPIEGAPAAVLASLDPPSAATRAAARRPAAGPPAAAVAREAAPAAPVPVARATGAAPAPARSQEPPEERRARLALLQEQARSCTKCRLHEQRKQAVFARGDPMAELCFVGEGPGADEDAQGEPFVGRAGQLLDKMIVAMGYARDEVYIANIVKCRPPENRKPELDEMETCSPFLAAQLQVVSPKAIVALGATAVQGLIGTSEGITRMRGKWKLYKGAIPVMPTFHPAYLLRQPNAKREVWADLQEVMKLLGKKPAR
jgi:uracil-DNA glycosylase